MAGQDYRRRLAQSMMQQALSPDRIAHPMQGVAKLAQAWIGNKMQEDMAKEQRATEAGKRSDIANALSAYRGDQPMPQGVPVEDFISSPGQYGEAGGGMVTQKGAGTDRGALLQALAGASDPALSSAGLQGMLAQPQASGYKLAEIGVEGQPKMRQRAMVLSSGETKPIGAPYEIGGGIQINTGAKKIEEELAKADVGRYKEAQSLSDATEGLDSTLDAIERDASAVNTGLLGGERAGAAISLSTIFGDEAGKVLGVESAKSAKNLQENLNRLTMENMKFLKGAMSEKELKFLVDSAPSLDSPPSAIVEYSKRWRAANDRARMKARNMRSWLEKNKSLEGFDASWSDYISANPLFDDTSTGQQGGVVEWSTL